LIELPVAAIAFWLWKKPMKMLWLVAGLNVITVSALWLSFVPTGEVLSNALNENIAVGAIFAFLVLELAVVIVEALALWKWSARFEKTQSASKTKQKKIKAHAGLTTGQAGLLSLVMNVASMVGGFILLSMVAALMSGA
jgi:hypothetical protein